MKSTPLARRSSVMEKVTARGGDIVMKKKWKQQKFWNGLREKSKSQNFGYKGVTKKIFTEYLGELREDKQDPFSRKRVNKFADAFGISRRKLVNASVKARLEQKNAKIQEGQSKTEDHQKETHEQEKRVEKKNEINSHINEIISKAHENAQAKDHDTPAKHVSSVADNERGDNFQNTLMSSLSASDNNIRKAEEKLLYFADNHVEANKTENTNHIMFLKNMHHDYVGEETSKIEETKSRLARIQGEADNYDEDGGEEKIAVNQN